MLQTSFELTFSASDGAVSADDALGNVAIFVEIYFGLGRRLEAERCDQADYASATLWHRNVLKLYQE